MDKWYGSAAVCINAQSQLLMVLQGKPDEKKTWSIPSGGVEKRETFEECCLRELKEETGDKGEIIRKIKVKNGRYEDIGVTFEVHYFLI